MISTSLSKVRCFTWNTQGNYTKADKKKVIDIMFTKYECDVGMIQEGGTPEKPLTGYGSITSGSTPGSFNERCTNYIIYKKKGISIDLETIGGGDAGRSPAALKDGSTLFVSWHSIACGNNLDSKSLIQECANEVKVGNYSRVIIGGDFNASPEDLEDLVTRFSGTRAAQSLKYRTFSPDDATHQGGEILDHFVVISSKDISLADPVVVEVSPSDHNPVYVDIM